MRFLLLLTLLLATGAALADPPMKTVYSDSSTTKFAWTWPYHTTQTRTYVQDYPLPMGSALQNFYSYGTPEDVSQYRFHNYHLTYRNEWGYFFPPHTRPVKTNGVVLFVSPQGYTTQAK